MSEVADSDLPDSPDPLSSPPWADQFEFAAGPESPPPHPGYSEGYSEDDTDGGSDTQDNSSTDEDVDEELDEEEIDDEDLDEDLDEEEDFADPDDGNAFEQQRRLWGQANALHLGEFLQGGMAIDLDFDDAFGDHFHEEEDLEGELIRLEAENHFEAIQRVLIHQLGSPPLLDPQWDMRSPSPMEYPRRDRSRSPSRGAGVPQQRYGRERDQLVQVEMERHGNRFGGGRGEQDRGRRQPPRDIIDLTGEEDAAMRRPDPDRPQSGNLRRQRSQPQNYPPRLNRSDGSYVEGQPVIVLSSSDDEEEQQSLNAPPRRNANNNNNHNHSNRPVLFNHHSDPHAQPRHHNHNHNHNHHNNHNQRNQGMHGSRNNNARNPMRPRLSQFSQFVHNFPLFQLMNDGMAAPNNRGDDDIVITGTRPRLAAQGAAPNQRQQHQLIGFGAINLDYGAAHPFAALPALVPQRGGGTPPKPKHQPPDPARPGFSRDTGEDVVAICPSCEQELAYDPDGEDEPPTPARKSRAKKSQAEQHFWAVKACGHVYCKSCFDNRRPTKTSKKVGFRPDPAGGKKIICAVEDCDSDVSAKAAWRIVKASTATGSVNYYCMDWEYQRHPFGAGPEKDEKNCGNPKPLDRYS
ncbi:hypothetical protein GGS20DRAFT_583708 [Poronia punctata]|nr:hypothetical protein GGS20DRAFT_583708 [Poronia punctata]